MYYSCEYLRISTFLKTDIRIRANSTATAIREYKYSLFANGLARIFAIFAIRVTLYEKLYLLQGHQEPQKDKPPTQVTSCMWHYLTMVKTQKHREAITSILLSTHLLAVEVLRYVDHAHQPVPRSERLCRFCKKEVETPEHALITCESSDALVELRATFLRKLFTDLPDLCNQMVELSNTEFLKAIIYPRLTIALVAKYVFDVLELFYVVPVFRLDAD